MLNRIRNFVVSQKYVKSETDSFAIGNKVYIFDHSNEDGTYENLTDGDGFDIRAVIDLGEDVTTEEIQKINAIQTDGRLANNQDIYKIVAQIKRKRRSNKGNAYISSVRRPKMGNDSMADENDGARIGSTADVSRSVVSSGENQGNDSGRRVNEDESEVRFSLKHAEDESVDDIVKCVEKKLIIGFILVIIDQSKKK